MPFTERVRRTGWGLFWPPFFTLFPIALTLGLMKILWAVWPRLRGTPDPKLKFWAGALAFVIAVSTVGLQELALVNSEYADLDEMVRTRLGDLEASHRD